MERSKGAAACDPGGVTELLILARAESEVLEIQARLDDISHRLANRFSERIEAALDQLSNFPESGPIYAAHARRLLVRDFPIGVFYSIEGRRAVVLAVLDLHQDPQSIQRCRSLE